MRYIEFLTTLLLCLCIFPIALKAEEIITWDKCVEEAKENHPLLVSAEEKLNQTRADKSITLSNILPQINTDLSERTSKTNDADKTNKYSYSITGRQLLFDGFKSFYDIAQSDKDLRASFFNYQKVSSDIRLSLRYAFVELLRAQELLSITEDIAKRRRQDLELVELRYEAGREHKGALLTAEANLVQAEFEVVQARRNISVAQRRLTKELGRTKLAPIIVKGDFEVKYSPAQKPDFEILAETTPFLQELISQKEASRYGLKSARADFFPEIYASGSAGRTDTSWPPEKDEWSAGVSLSFPLFEGGSRIARVSKAKAILEQAQADERSGRDSVVLTLEETWTDLQDAVDEVKVQVRFLEATRERAKIAQAQYSTGLLYFDNWIIIEDELVKSKKSYLTTQINALLAEADWIKAKGGTLEEE